MVLLRVEVAGLIGPSGSGVKAASWFLALAV